MCPEQVSRGLNLVLGETGIRKIPARPKRDTSPYVAVTSEADDSREAGQAKEINAHVPRGQRLLNVDKGPHPGEAHFLVPGKRRRESCRVVERGHMAAGLVSLSEPQETACAEGTSGWIVGIKVSAGQAIARADVVVDVAIELVL